MASFFPLLLLPWAGCQRKVQRFNAGLITQCIVEQKQLARQFRRVTRSVEIRRRFFLVTEIDEWRRLLKLAVISTHEVSTLRNGLDSSQLRFLIVILNRESAFRKKSFYSPIHLVNTKMASRGFQDNEEESFNLRSCCAKDSWQKSGPKAENALERER